jgi:chromosome segregation protein
MYLKSVDLYGFKSFANKMVFKFEKGITGIVGPNGSGKSNVADAVRWVLGEQSAKQLRGAKMEDVIFAGTETRRPLGYCQVDLTIDNQDKMMPIDYSEVTVSRRVYRSGESEYYINGTTCRLRDVQELFMDTGVGREGYSIIGQGQVDKILSSKPDDRRALFDEAAGIVKYKSRKNAAEKKLLESELDLERIDDIIGELELRKVSLEEQSEVAKVYLSQREELKKLEVTSFIRLIDEFDEKLQVHKNNEQVAQTELSEKERLYTEIAQKHHDFELQFEEIEVELEKNRELITETSLKSEKLQSAITLSEEKTKNHLFQIANLKTDMERVQSSEIERGQQLNNLKNDQQKITNRIEKREAELQQRQADSDTLQADIDIQESSIDEIQSAMIERLNKVSAIKNQAHRNELMIENNELKMEHIEARSKVLKETVVSLESEIELSKDTLNRLEADQKNYLDQKLSLRKSIQEEEILLSTEKHRLSNLRHELNKTNSRHDALKEMEDQYEGYYLSVKKVMELKDSGTLGVIAEIIHVDKKYEKAIEIALGSNLQNIVTTNEEKAKEYINFLKNNKYGRGTFLPMTTVKGQAASDIKRVDGFLGVASELIDCEQRFKPIMHQLLGRILLVNNLDEGILLSKANNQSYRIITLDGDVISPGGAMSGGAFQKEKGQLLSRKNELEELTRLSNELQSTVTDLEVVIQKQEDHIVELKEEIDVIRIKEQELNLELHTITTLLSSNQSELHKMTQDLCNYETELNELHTQTDSLLLEKEKLENDLANTETNHTDAELKVQEIGELIQVLKADKDILQEEITADKVELSSLKQQLEHTLTSIATLSETLQAKTETLVTIRQEINQVELRNLKEAMEMKQFQEEQLIEKTKLADLNNHLADLRYRRQEIQIAKGQLDSKKDQALEVANSLEKELIRLQNTIEKLELLKETQINYMWDEYELTYTSALLFKDPSDISEASLKQRIARIKLEMKELGDVNVRAIEEYREVKERFLFLSEQKADLASAKEKLLLIIGELDAQMVIQFREKFDHINEKFNSVFSELFGGGKGYLELIDDDNILESGIAIIAQPPGKKLQNMMLLSGGERAFTAIALLFAIQSLRPSPFCVLDEIEAALDDANVDRFAQYLRKLTDQTQFIVITHRKGTMEAADALYGITMQEKGISTQVSVKLIRDQLEQPVH